MSESAIEILERRLAIHIQRRNDLYTTLHEVETDIENIRRSMHRHIHAMRDAPVVEPEEAVVP